MCPNTNVRQIVWTIQLIKRNYVCREWQILSFQSSVYTQNHLLLHCASHLLQPATYRVTSSAPTLSEQRLRKIYTDSQLLAKKPRNYLVVNTSMMWEYRKPLLLVVSFVKKQNQNKVLEIVFRVLNYLVNSQERNTFWPLYCVLETVPASLTVRSLEV